MNKNIEMQTQNIMQTCKK